MLLLLLLLLSWWVGRLARRVARLALRARVGPPCVVCGRVVARFGGVVPINEAVPRRDVALVGRRREQALVGRGPRVVRVVARVVRLARVVGLTRVRRARRRREGAGVVLVVAGGLRARALAGAGVRGRPATQPQYRFAFRSL